jgi:hypothetical protein
MTDKRIFILGSGSSIGHSNGLFPSILGFFSSAYKLGYHRTESFRKVELFARQILGKNIFTSKSTLDIEAFFTLIEIEIERNPSPDLLYIRNELLLLIQRVLLELESRLKIDDSEYDYFIKLLRKTDTIITYNWDILLDNKLSRKEILEKRYHKDGDYNIDVKHYENFVVKISAFSEATWEYISVNEPYEEWNPESGFYIKAHGSVDWYYCGNEACRAYRKVFPVQNPLSQHYCSECHEELSCLIIPPVLNKSYRNYPIIRKIWNIAAKEIASSSELIIWGYSLPPTDFYTSWLIRQARKGHIKQITLINPEVITKSKKQVRVRISFVRKYYDIFRDILPKGAVFLYETFSDYYNKNDIFKKYSLLESGRMMKNI